MRKEHTVALKDTATAAVIKAPQTDRRLMPHEINVSMMSYHPIYVTTGTTKSQFSFKGTVHPSISIRSSLKTH